MEAMLAQREKIRSPIVAGMFYPEDRAEMLESISAFGLRQGKGGLARALIAPHGAWDISGALAGAAFATAGGRNNISTVVILGPIHDKREEGLFLSHSHFFQTPLGRLPVDEEITEDLETCGNHFEINDIPHLGEHSIEVLLPFVKFCFPNAAIVPILMGHGYRYNAEHIADLAQTLKMVLQPIMDETLVVASCNFSSASDKAKSRFLAEETLRLFSAKNAAELTPAILEGRIYTCGGALVAGLVESGLLDEMRPCPVGEDMVAAEGVGNTTVHYGAVSFE